MTTTRTAAAAASRGRLSLLAGAAVALPVFVAFLSAGPAGFGLAILLILGAAAVELAYAPHTPALLRALRRLDPPKAPGGSDAKSGDAGD